MGNLPQVNLNRQFTLHRQFTAGKSKTGNAISGNPMPVYLNTIFEWNYNIDFNKKAAQKGTSQESR